MRDLKNNLDVVHSLVPAAYTASANGSGVDLQGFEGAMVVFSVGAADFANGDEAYFPVVEESADGSTYTVVPAEKLEGSLNFLAANSLQRVGYKGGQRYLRAHLSVSGTSPSTQASAVVVRGRPHAAPLT
jgi:hypothetical protein